jgi:ABC-type transport system involved in cytochrome bd biosynthesis fused ATPase/permease subunit
MGLDSEQWRTIYQIFDPTLRLEASDMDLFVQRPDSASQVIAEEIQLGLEPQGKWVLCGSVGSGKSSELVRLTQLLGTKTHAPIGIDLTLSAARVDLLTPPEVLFLIGAGALRAA